MNFWPHTWGVWTWGGALSQWQWTPDWTAGELPDWRTPQWVTPGTDSNSRHGRAATEEELTALPPPEDDDSCSNSPSIQSRQGRYVDFMRLPRDQVKIEQGQEEKDSGSTSGDSSSRPPRLTPVSRANAQRVPREEKEAKSS